ncbi:MAG: hypothetical protein V4512_06815 [Pseudomonadota bacterium]
MSFIDMEITRRQFAARYVNLGRAMLAMLADIYGVDFDVAENWADAIDREAQVQIVADAGIDGDIGGDAGFCPASPPHHSHSAALDPEASHSGAEPLGAACTAAPSLSHSYPVGSRRGSGAATVSPGAAAPDNFSRS